MKLWNALKRFPRMSSHLRWWECTAWVHCGSTDNSCLLLFVMNEMNYVTISLIYICFLLNVMQC